jgi:hypothetical protein
MRKPCVNLTGVNLKIRFTQVYAGLRIVYAWFTQISHFSVYAWFTHGLRRFRMVYAGLRRFPWFTQVYACKSDDAGLQWFTLAGALGARPGLRRRRPRRCGASRAGAARGPTGPARPSSPPPPPSRRIPGRSRPLPGRPYRSAVAAHPGRLARPGLRRRRPPSRRIPGRSRPGPAGPARPDRRTILMSVA